MRKDSPFVVSGRERRSIQEKHVERFPFGGFWLETYVYAEEEWKKDSFFMSFSEREEI